MKIAIGSDHAAKDLKSLVVDFLTLSNHTVLDYGVASDSTASVDYSDYADIVASEVSAGRCDAAVLICGTGIGMCITANKFPGVRAALVFDEFTARMCKAHNDANVICLGSRTTNHQRAIDFVKIWLSTTFEEGRHKTRLAKITAIEKRNTQLS
jgi:ribose 5-phosphate isomerase B